MGKKITTMYVTFSERSQRGAASILMAQLGLYSTKSKKKLKRNQTQRQLSYGWRHRVDMNGIITSYDGKIMLQPKKIENVPLYGFKIVDFETTGSRGNKVWRIRDPRGFDVIVPTSSVAKIISTCTIEEGYISHPCVWYFGKEGCGSPTLVPATISKA